MSTCSTEGTPSGRRGAETRAGGGLRATAFTGAVYLGTGQAIKVFVQIASVLVFARLLTPTDFGVFAMVSPILALVTILRDAGVNGAIIQRAALTDTELSSLFWLSLGSGLGLTLLLALLAPFVASFYGEPRLTDLLVASGAVVLSGSLSLQHMALMNRQLRYAALSVVDAGSLAIGFIVGAYVAWMTRSYWGLWAMALGTTVAQVVLSWLLCGWRPGAPGRVDHIRDVLGVGGNITAAALFDFISRSVDKVLIGRQHGTFQLGLYDRAYRIVLLPLNFVTIPLGRILLPALMQSRGEPARFRLIFRLAQQVTLLAVAPASIVVIALPEPVCTLVLGTQWLTAAPLLSWLGLASLLQFVSMPLGTLLISQGRSRDWSCLGAVSCIFSCVAFVLGLPYGARGVAAAYAISELFRTPLVVWWATRRGSVSSGEFLRTLLPFVPAAVLAYGLITFLKYQISFPATSTLPLFVFLPLSYAVTLGALAATATGKSCLAEIAGTTRRFMFAK